METMNFKTTNFKRALAVAAGIILLTGCNKERYPSSGGNGNNDGKSKEVIFSVNVPGQLSAATRALGDREESEVKTVEILLFDSSTKEVAGDPVFVDMIISDPNDDGNFRIKTFNALLPEGKFDVMIFANSRAVFNSVQIEGGDSQETTIAKLTASMPETGWIADPNDAAKRYLIPMWGIRENLTVGQNTSVVTDVYLHRMVARIDLNVTGDDSQTGNFRVKDIKLYNVQKEGRIAPQMENWNKSGMVNGILPAGLAVAPSLTGSGVYASPISYAQAISANQKNCAGEIYLFEAPRATADADLNAPFLTVKGEFNGVDGWYRVDFVNRTTMEYMDVLRNHLYRITIDRVSGAGFPNEEDAINNTSSRMDIVITLWNEYDLGGSAFEGSHFLSINPQDINFNNEEQIAQTITVKTDINSHISMTNIKLSGSENNPGAPLDGGWIKNLALSAKSEVNGKNVWTLTYDIEANAGSARTGYIYVTIGRMTNIVRIAQEEYIAPSVFTVSTIAGSGVQGFADGMGMAAQFHNPNGIATDISGNIYVADEYNNRIRMITPQGEVTTIAGDGTLGSANGQGTAAKFYFPYGITIDVSGNLYVTDRRNHCIRKITQDGMVSTFAGGGTQGYIDGLGDEAKFYSPYGIATDVLGNIYVSDGDNHRIRKITPEGMVSTFAGSTQGGTQGYVDGTAEEAKFNTPVGIAIDVSGNLYVADSNNNRIRKITPEGMVSTFAGSGEFGYADGHGTAAQFSKPYGITIDASGNLYVADYGNNRIRKITPQGEVTTIAGSGEYGYVDGPAGEAQFSMPQGIAIDASGNLYVTDTGNHRIRKITME